MPWIREQTWYKSPLHRKLFRCLLIHQTVVRSTLIRRMTRAVSVDYTWTQNTETSGQVQPIIFRIDNHWTVRNLDCGDEIIESRKHKFATTTTRKIWRYQTGRDLHHIRLLDRSTSALTKTHFPFHIFLVVSILHSDRGATLGFECSVLSWFVSTFLKFQLSY